MRVAIIGQSLFGKEVYKLLRTQGHNVVAVFTIPDVKGRADPLAEIAEKDDVRVFKFPRWRTKGKPLPESCHHNQLDREDLWYQYGTMHHHLRRKVNLQASNFPLFLPPPSLMPGS